MAPKKRARASTRNASTPAQDEDSMVVDTPDVVETPDIAGSIKKDDYDVLKDPWTDEQETSLFKAIIRWKPAGEFELYIARRRHSQLTDFLFKVCTSTFV